MIAIAKRTFTKSSIYASSTSDQISPPLIFFITARPPQSRKRHFPYLSCITKAWVYPRTKPALFFMSPYHRAGIVHGGKCLLKMVLCVLLFFTFACPLCSVSCFSTYLECMHAHPSLRGSFMSGAKGEKICTFFPLPC